MMNRRRKHDESMGPFLSVVVWIVATLLGTAAAASMFYLGWNYGLGPALAMRYVPLLAAMRFFLPSIAFGAAVRIAVSSHDDERG